MNTRRKNERDNVVLDEDDVLVAWNQIVMQCSKKTAMHRVKNYTFVINPMAVSRQGAIKTVENYNLREAHFFESCNGPLLSPMGSMQGQHENNCVLRRWPANNSRVCNGIDPRA